MTISYIENDDITDVYLINKKSEIEIMSILNDFTTESALCSMYESDNENSIVKMLQRVSKAILDSIASVFDMIANLFGGNSKISKDEYLKSRQGDMIFKRDILKEQKYINGKAKEGNNIIKRLLNGEQVHDKVVNFVNDTARMLETPDGRNKIYAAAAPIVYGYYVDLKDTMTEFRNLNANVIRKMDHADLDNEDLKSVVRTIQNLTARSNNLVSMYFREYDKLSTKEDAKYKTMKVK